MNIHEYQAKAVLKEFGVAVPRGYPAFSVDEALNGARQLGGPVWVVKAQIHAGGRGKAGGVKVVKTVDDVKTEATRILGSTLVTHQTGPKGKQVNRLYIEEGSDIERELYLSLLVDRGTGRVAFVASTEGGMDIGVFYFPVDYGIGMVELATALEERGFESIFVPEHTHIPTSRKSPFPGGGELPKKYSHTHDPFVALS